jgi:hypothetical protein
MAKKKTSEIEVFYLHGFASSPESEKAKYFKNRFQILGIDLIIPDLNVPSFEEINFQAIVDFMNNTINASLTKNLILIGSSLGALVALAIAEKNRNVQKLVLLAPAVHFQDRLPEIIGEENFKKWRIEGSIPIYHHQLKKEVPVHFEFIESLKEFDITRLNINIPVQIFHGAFDEIIPFEKVEIFAKSLPKCEFHLLETNHQMLNKLDWMWRDIYRFLEIEKEEAVEE